MSEAIKIERAKYLESLDWNCKRLFSLKYKGSEFGRLKIDEGGKLSIRLIYTFVDIDTIAKAVSAARNLDWLNISEEAEWDGDLKAEKPKLKLATSNEQMPISKKVTITPAFKRQGLLRIGRRGGVPVRETAEPQREREAVRRQPARCVRFRGPAPRNIPLIVPEGLRSQTGDQMIPIMKKVARERSTSYRGKLLEVGTRTNY